MADLSSLLQIQQQMQGRLSEIQSQLAQQTVTVSAGGGIVQATADGRGQIRAIKIDPQAVSQGEMLFGRRADSRYAGGKGSFRHA
jgi:DNA-binding protein YbaB